MFLESKDFKKQKMLFLRNEDWGCPLASIHSAHVCCLHRNTLTELWRGDRSVLLNFFLLVIANLTDECQVCDL